MCFVGGAHCICFVQMFSLIASSSADGCVKWRAHLAWDSTFAYGKNQCEIALLTRSYSVHGQGQEKIPPASRIASRCTFFPGCVIFLKLCVLLSALYSQLNDACRLEERSRMGKQDHLLNSDFLCTVVTESLRKITCSHECMLNIIRSRYFFIDMIGEGAQ